MTIHPQSVKPESPAAPRELATFVDCSDHPVVAAVHLDSRHFDDVLARGIARSAETQSALIVFSVITRSSIGHALTRLHQKLARCPVPVQLIATRVSGTALSASERATAIGRDIAEAAERLDAQAVVIGHTPDEGATGTSVRGAVATWLRPGVELCFGTPGLAALDRLAWLESAEGPMPDLHAIHLTDDGRQVLAARAIAIDRRQLPRARRALQRHPDSVEAVRGYETQVNELRRLLHLVAEAPSTADLPDDPDRVDLGERVEIVTEAGAHRQLRIVDPIEVTRGRGCVASTSSLGRALLGRRVGEWAAIPTARGRRKAHILSATR